MRTLVVRLILANTVKNHPNINRQEEDMKLHRTMTITVQCDILAGKQEAHAVGESLAIRQDNFVSL